MVNKLILGDNLEILKTIDSETIDLIYLDPPFFSNRNYEVIWGDEGEVRSFQDRWSGGIDHYIAWLKERVEQMHRILKPTGSIFLHCDWHANAYIRVMILDRIFGGDNFRNEITWKRSDAKGDFGQGAKHIGRTNDTIWFYSKSDNFSINALYTPLGEDYVDSFYRHIDENGKRYKLDNMLGPGGAAKGNLFYEVMGVGRYWRYSKEKMQQLIAEGRVIQTNPGTVPMYKRYLDESKGVPLTSVWTDIDLIRGHSKEKIGYPTQKPEALMQRIIEMASNEGDIVLDPFVGGGTTVAVADKLNRKWLGIDQSVQAVKITELRLDKQRDLFSEPFTVQLHKYDYDTLRYKNAFEFESWIVQQFGGVSNTKQRGDLGLDGKMPDNTPIQVKRSDNIGRNVIDNFLSAVQRFDKKLFEENVASRKTIGYIIAFSFGKGAVQEVARLSNQENIIIELVTVDKIVPIAKKPTITVEINDLTTVETLHATSLQLETRAHAPLSSREIQFVATGTSEAGIEFYSWDFNYSPPLEGQGEVEGAGGGSFHADIMLDKDGKQTAKFKAGQHTIAVKVVDNDGLENIEIIKLKVNGKVERQ